MPKITIRLTPDIEVRLRALAKQTGRTKTHFVRAAILEHIDDLEDYYLAARVLRRVSAGTEEILSLEAAEKMIL